MTKNQPLKQVGSIYWELRDGPNGEVSASGSSESLKSCLMEIAANAKVKVEADCFVVPPGLHVYGSPYILRTSIKEQKPPIPWL